MSNKAEDGSNNAYLKSLKEVEAKINLFAKAIYLHVTNEDYNAQKDELDILSVKNSMMLSYLIDMVHMIRLAKQLQQKNITKKQKKQIEKAQLSCFHRLNEMRVAFEKMRTMEKKLRYQLDKLLSLSLNASQFSQNTGSFTAMEAATGEETQENTDAQNQQISDPLMYKPNMDDMLDEDGDASGSDNGDESDGDSDSASDEEEDEDLKAARLSIGMTADKPKQKKVYQPPRLLTQKYDNMDPDSRDPNDKKLPKDQRRQQRLLSSNVELLNTLQSQYTDRPEEDDYYGGASSKHSSENHARQQYERQQKAKEKMEEDYFIRLAPTREEKKKLKKLQQRDRSNMHELTGDLSRMSRSIHALEKLNSGANDPMNNETYDDPLESRHARKRKGDFSSSKKKRSLSKVKAGNVYQKELFGASSYDRKKAKKKR